MATFHENLVQSFKNFRDKYLKANNVIFQFSYDSTSGKFGYKDANGNFVPFRTVQASKTVTAGTSSSTVTPDSGYDGIASVTVNPTPSTSITPSNTSPASMSSGNLYNPSSSGYAISSYSSVSPSSSGAYFSSGMIKMGSSGYAYSSRPSQQSGYMSSGTTLWSNSSPTSNQGSQTITISGYFSSYSWLEFKFRRSTTDSTSISVWCTYSDFSSTGGDGYMSIGCVYAISNGMRYRRVAYSSSNSCYLSGGNMVNGNTRSDHHAGCILTAIVGHNIYP